MGRAQATRRAVRPSALVAAASRWRSTASISPRGFTLAIVAVAGFNAVLGIAAIVALAPYAWATDVERNLAAAADLVAGRFGTDRGYLYSPLAAALTVPATWLPVGVAIGGWLALRVAILIEGIRRETEGWRPVDRVAAGVAAVTFVPTLYDLMLGNVTILMTASVALVAWSRDRVAAGIALGAFLAMAPKPALAPILVWMLIYRRRALVGTVVTAVVTTAGCVLLVGLEPYLAYVNILRRPQYLDGPQQLGNMALTALPPVVAIVLGAIAVAVTVVALRRGETPGFVAALAAGLLLAPYTMAYGPVMLLLAFRPLLAVGPIRAFCLAMTGSLMVIVSLPLWAFAWLAAVLSVARETWAERAPTVAR
jgi:glycosyl transferase family 87